MARDTHKAFVIHGHNLAARAELCHMLGSAFALTPVVLADLPGMSRTTIELLEAAIPGCDVAVALVTGDDRSLSQNGETLRSRQNVVFELGYAAAALGRDRICILYEEGVELPSDLLGVTYYSFKHAVTETEPGLRRHLGELGLLASTCREHTIVVVDDDLAGDSLLVRHIEKAFAGCARIVVVNDPAEARRLLQSRAVAGCISDLVFRNGSGMEGVRVAERAIASSVPVVIATGHRREHIGLELGELQRIGLSAERILNKPVTAQEYKDFLSVLTMLLPVTPLP